MLPGDYQLILEFFSIGILIFWGLWTLLVALSDTMDLIERFSKNAVTFKFNSKNFQHIQVFWRHYHIESRVLSLLTYLFIILITYCVFVFFLWAIMSFFLDVREIFFLMGCYAFLLSLAVNAMFILIDELFIQFEMGKVHMIRFCVRLISFSVFLFAATHMPLDIIT